MFDLSPDEIQETVKETLHEFAEKELRPAAREAESSKAVPDQIVSQIQEMGFIASVPEEHGGAGVFDAVTTVLIAGELAWGDPGIAAALLWAGQPATIISAIGTDEQQAKYLPRFTGSEPVKGSLLLYEADYGADLGKIKTTARKAGSDWLLDGEKAGVPYPADADLRVVIAGIEGSNELGAFVLPESFKPHVVRNDSETGKIGLRAAPTGNVKLRGMLIKGDTLLGGDERNSRQLAVALGTCRLQTGAIAVGLARAASEYAAHYATERIAFGKPIGAFQGVSFMITDMAMDVEVSEMLVWDAASQLSKGHTAERAIALANSKALKTAYRCGTDSVQVLGGHGFIIDHPVEKWYRDAAALAGFEGPADQDPILAEEYCG